MPSPRHCLVSGGAGFIGSHLVEHLLARGDRVTVVDNLSTGRRANLDEASKAGGTHLRFIEADLSHALQALGKGEVFDEIYHLAAAVGVRLVVEEPIRSIETNVDQTAAILRFATTHSATSRRDGRVPILIASSSEVYGKSTHSPFREDDDVTYGPTTVSRWSYACSKAIDEFLALGYSAQRQVPVVIARFFNTVGPRQIGDYGMVLPRFVKSALQNLPIDVHGDGQQSRCFCDVRDVVTVLPRLLADHASHGRVFNVGSDQPISIRDLADRVIATLNSRSQVRLIPYTEAYGAGFEDLRQRRPDLTRVREAVGFRPQIPLEETIRAVARSITETGE
ncbi:MAG: GDP-mannose 4,6-dehydratase [Phycisphaerales bacterium]|nr:GDP-mannose 4,6-dehydratase [Phycisphaerales bacterium]